MKRSLYGLKQASRQWNKELCKFLASIGFTQYTQDYGQFIILLIYVDDILLTSTSQDQIDTVKQQLDSAFMIKDLGSMKYFLGIEVMRTSEGTLLSQKKYIKDIISSSGMNDNNGASTPS